MLPSYDTNLSDVVYSCWRRGGLLERAQRVSKYWYRLWCCLKPDINLHNCKRAIFFLYTDTIYSIKYNKSVYIKCIQRATMRISKSMAIFIQ